MKSDEFKNNLCNFIESATCSYTCIKQIERLLKDNGFEKLNDSDNYKLDNNKYYIIKNDASIIAFDLSNVKNKSFSIITSHSDVPALLLKPNGAYIKNDYLKYNVMPYGGLLNYGWLDHPLSLAGRIIVRNNNELKVKIVDFKKPMLIIPSVAIHQNDKANSNLDLNMQIDLQPIISISDNNKTWSKILKKEIKDEIVDYDLYTYTIEKPTFIGQNNELFISPRVDNITSVYASLHSFLNSNTNNIKVFCSFNSEEIGSLTVDGADSNFLLDILKKIAGNLKLDIVSTLSNSFVISSDNTHAIHPNHSEFADDTSAVYLGKGLTIVKESSSSTNGLSSSIIKTICDNNKIKYQDATSKNDLAGGSTLSGISLRHVSVMSIDVGVGELAMHSSIETCNINDVYELYKMMKAFYETNILIKNNNIKIN